MIKYEKWKKGVFLLCISKINTIFAAFFNKLFEAVIMILNNESFEKYVKLFEYQNEGNYTTGNGVLVEHYLVTAAHVAISADTLRFYHEGRTYVLSSDDAVFIKDQKTEEEIIDLAVFDLHEKLSPLQFADNLPFEHETLQSVSVRPIDNDFKVTICNVQLESIVHKAMLCKTDVELTAGSSGSPLISEGKLFGILIGGFPTDDKFLILYQPVLGLLNKLK